MLVFRKRTVVTAVTDPKTLRPRSVVSEATSVLEIEGSGPQSHRERQAYEFDWAGDAGAND